MDCCCWGVNYYTKPAVFYTKWKFLLSDALLLEIRKLEFKRLAKLPLTMQ